MTLNQLKLLYTYCAFLSVLVYIISLVISIAIASIHSEFPGSYLAVDYCCIISTSMDVYIHATLS